MAETKQKPRKKQTQTAASTAGKKSSNDQPTPVPDYWLNKRQVCDSLGITATAFDKWKVEPTARQGNKNYYTVRSLLDNREEALVRKMQLERPAQSSDKLDPIHEGARLSKQRADKLELENEIARGKQLPIGIQGLVLSKIADRMAAALDAIPGKIKRKEPGLSASSLDLVRREIVKAQNAAADVSKYLDEIIDDLGIPATGD
ncbi:terminase small subunit [Microbulbifer variabilis]|uniref:Terminase small subunit n=1 Tax=Microbulbifer variabilis TaxID=266805 RepID=A0ABY4V6A1_9GAMM|nr:terminase small subunit [Microbulbifer variabilis]USD19799.1 terminase small subunit [Microbulbifer variabilis]